MIYILKDNIFISDNTHKELTVSLLTHSALVTPRVGYSGVVSVEYTLWYPRRNISQCASTKNAIQIIYFGMFAFYVPVSPMEVYTDQ